MKDNPKLAGVWFSLVSDQLPAEYLNDDPANRIDMRPDNKKRLNRDTHEPSNPEQPGKHDGKTHGNNGRSGDGKPANTLTKP